MQAGLLVNTLRRDAVEAAQEAVSWLRANDFKVVAESETAAALGVDGEGSEELAASDLMISFGGDGTLIRAAHICAHQATPILGVFYGRFGFVTQVGPDRVIAALEDFKGGKSTTEDRMMIQTELLRSGETVATLHSLNETVVQRAATARMLTFEVKVNGTVVSRYPADGILMSTPTGSTAYSLSAGGPVLEPTINAILMTALMPHTLSARPIVLPDTSEIVVTIRTAGDAVLSCDGQSRLHLLSGDSVRVTRSSRIARLIRVSGDDFLQKLSNRLNWSQGPAHAR